MNKLRLFVLLIAIPAIGFIWACNPDDDPFSDQEARDNYIGTWRVQESDKGKITYEVVISADPNNSTQVLINNFYNYGIEPYALVTATNITIPSQSFSKYLQLNGSGTLSGSKITWTYYVNNGADLDTIQSVYTKL
ncbi:MAG: hypothetical protein AB9842_12310 [Bacteroidales bacterium]